MGRIKTKLVKALTEDIYKKYKDRFTTNFTENKEILKGLSEGISKKLRNIVAGYLTRMKIRDLRDQV